jgi:hypothetical protein
VCSMCLQCTVCFSIAREVYLGELLQLRALNAAWTSKALPLWSLSSYSENIREARAFFSGVAATIFGRVMGEASDSICELEESVSPSEYFNNGASTPATPRLCAGGASGSNRLHS